MSDPLPGVPLGSRVVVRHLIEDGERATDVVGELVGRDGASLTVLGRHGPVRVAVGDVVVAKVVPAAAPRWRVASFLARAGAAVIDLGSLHRLVRGASDQDAAATAVVGLVDRLEADGTPVVVLGREADAVLADLARHVLTVSDPGELPTASTLEEVHGAIETRLGRPVGRGTVHYTDDRPEAVVAAREVGWQGRVLTPPMHVYPRVSEER